MRKFILSSFFAILLFSCGTKKENIVYDVPIEIILDHPIADINIKNAEFISNKDNLSANSCV